MGLQNLACQFANSAFGADARAFGKYVGHCSPICCAHSPSAGQAGERSSRARGPRRRGSPTVGAGAPRFPDSLRSFPSGGAGWRAASSLRTSGEARLGWRGGLQGSGCFFLSAFGATIPRGPL